MLFIGLKGGETEHPNADRNRASNVSGSDATIDVCVLDTEFSQKIISTKVRGN